MAEYSAKCPPERVGTGERGQDRRIDRSSRERLDALKSEVRAYENGYQAGFDAGLGAASPQNFLAGLLTGALGVAAVAIVVLGRVLP